MHKHNAPVICNQAPTHLRDRVGNSRAKVQGNDFSIVPTVLGKCWGSNIRTSTLNELFCYVVGLRAGPLPSICPHRVVLIPGH